MTRRAALLLPLLVCTAATEPKASDTIEVIGRKPEEVRREAQAFVRQLGVAEQPVARFVDPVCPKAIGVAPEIAARVEARVREIAKEAGARLAPKRCDGNLMVAFGAKTDAIIAEVARRTPTVFENAKPADIAALKASTAPIRWWHTTEERTSSGTRGGGNDAPPAMAGLGSSTEGVRLGGQVFQQYNSSFLGTQMMRVLTTAAVVIDVDRATGTPLDSVSALAGLVGLAEVRFGEEPPPNSILSLFAAGGPRDLTTLDQNFLRTLYRMPLDRTAVAHRGLLVRGLVRADGQRRP